MITAPSNVSERIKNFNSNLGKEGIHLKYQLMAQNQWRFFRGTCHLFYEDLSKAPPLPKSPLTWVCGDLHIENFGSYKGDNRQVYFDLNDFDESALAPACWELVRMVTSILIAFDSLEIGSRKALRIAELFLKTYSKTLAKGKARHIDPRTAKGIVQSFLDSVCHRRQKDLLKKRTVRKRTKLALLVTDKKCSKLEKGLKQELKHHLTQWLKFNEECPYNYKVIDVAYRIAGTGSLGVKRYISLLQSLNDAKDYLLIDMKEAMPSSIQPYNTIPQPQWPTEAKRTVTIQEFAENIAPALLSTTVFKGDAYVLQEMQPTEDKIDFNLIKDRYRDVYQVIDDMALLTASAHLRSSGRQGSAVTDEWIGFGKDDTWQAGIIKYAVAYASQIKRDYEQYVTDYTNGFFK